MGDQLERFIQDNRSSFDLPSGQSAEERWRNIEQKIEKKRNMPLLWRAAAVVFMLSTTFLVIDRYYSSSDETIESSRYSEFRQAEAFYTSLIDQKRTEIASQDIEGLSDDFLKEVEKLDEMYAALKKTFGRNVNDQQIMDAMIRNLQLRIDILNQQLKILETLKSVKNENVQNA